MSIEHAILGLLSLRSLSGYDLKKIFEESTVLYWSGNNNEIYRSLVRMRQEGWVSCEVQPQESLPARKVYTITALGRVELGNWVRTQPEPPQLRHAFLIQLSWADELEPRELDELLAGYEDEIFNQWLVQRSLAQGHGEPSATRPPHLAFLDVSRARTSREALLWGRIRNRWADFYESELQWVRTLRKELMQ